jgi:heme-degrading monooxygenase HmoA
MELAQTPKPPYYAVIFSSVLDDHIAGYEKTAEKMLALAKTQPGFLGVDSARNQIGITVSYWQSLDDIQSWKQHSEHLNVQEQGKQDWYRTYKVRICRVEKEYEFSQEIQSTNKQT